MAKKKPGVMIYFDPMHKEVKELDTQRKARLFEAILDYADPETSIDPDFSDDEVLHHVWLFVESDVKRDDETYRRKVGNKYSAFCRYCKENGYGSFGQNGDYIPPITRQEWDEAGQPTYKQWSASTLLTPNRETHTFHADAYERMQAQAAHTDASARMQAYAPQSAQKNAQNRRSDSNSGSNSFSGSNSMPEAGTEAPPGADAPGAGTSPALSPGILREALEKWRCHWEELHQSPMPSSTRNALAEEMVQQAEDFNPYAVADFVQKCISHGYKSLPWDKLEREEAARYRELEQAANRDDW